MKKNKYLEEFIMGPNIPTQLPKNRRNQFFYLIRENYGVLLLISMITFIFSIPMLFLKYVLSYRLSSIDQNSSASVLLSIHFFYALFMILAWLIMSIGLSGLMYIIRKMVWDEHFELKDYFLGIKLNIK